MKAEAGKGKEEEWQEESRLYEEKEKRKKKAEAARQLPNNLVVSLAEKKIALGRTTFMLAAQGPHTDSTEN